MNTFLAVFNAFPAVLEAVQAVEAAVPLPKSGEQKLNMVLGAATQAWEATQGVEQTTQSGMIAGIAAVANLTVAGLNAIGIFRHSASSTASAAAMSSN